jgi:hypothetical protein
MVAFIPNHIMSLVGSASNGVSHGETLAAQAPSLTANAAISAGRAAVGIGGKTLGSFAENSHHKMIFKL